MAKFSPKAIHSLSNFALLMVQPRKAIHDHKVFQFKKSSCGNNFCSKRTTIVNILNFSPSPFSLCHEAVLWQRLVLLFLRSTLNSASAFFFCPIMKSYFKCIFFLRISFSITHMVKCFTLRPEFKNPHYRLAVYVEIFLFFFSFFF